MIKSKHLSVMPKLFGHDPYRAMREKFISSARSRKRRPDEGGLLVEVLVGMFILVLVFTATTMSLSSLADNRTQVEQRDRGLKIAAKFEELARTFKCGFVVDRVDDALTTSRSLGSGLTEFQSKVSNCDFEAKYGFNPSHATAENAGDQDFEIADVINEGGTEQIFEVSIRYWWESPGASIESNTCSALESNVADHPLPAILVRSVWVNWDEKGIEREVSIIKRDTVPVDNVVFASGNRASSLIRRPGLSPALNDIDWEVDFYPYEGESLYISRLVDRQDNRLDGQPYLCAWFPYITPDDNSTDTRYFDIFQGNDDDGDGLDDVSNATTSKGAIDSTIDQNTVAQSFEVLG